MIYFAIYLCVCNLGLCLVASHYRERAKRLLHERDISRHYAAGLEQAYNAAMQRLDQRLHLFHHEAQPERLPQRKYTALVTNGMTPDGAFVVLTIASDRPHVLRRALEAIVVNVSPEQVAQS